MFFNLCMLGIHLLPLPGLLLGEWLVTQSKQPRLLQRYGQMMTQQHALYVLAICAASPVLDVSIGGFFVFPVYEQLASIAGNFQAGH